MPLMPPVPAAPPKPAVPPVPLAPPLETPPLPPPVPLAPPLDPPHAAESVDRTAQNARTLRKCEKPFIGSRWPSGAVFIDILPRARPAPSSCAAQYGNGDEQNAGRVIAGWGAGESARASARTAGLVAARDAAQARRCGAAASRSARDAGRATRADGASIRAAGTATRAAVAASATARRAASATACPARARLAAHARARLAAHAPPAGASAATATARTAGAAHASVLVERRAVERHHDDFAAVVRAGRDLVVLVHVGHGEGHVGDEPIFDQHARPLHLEPVVDGTVGVAEESASRISDRRPIPDRSSHGCRRTR